MRGLRGAIFVFAVLSSAVLLSLSAPIVPADTVRVYYQEVQGIQVDFPNGKVIEDGKELIIITSSNIYDMERSGIMFYERGSDGKPDMTTSVTPDHYSVSEGNIVTHVFINLNKDIEMHFTELKKLETQTSTGEPGEGISLDIEPATIVALAAMILAAIMLVLISQAARKFGILTNGPGASP